VITTTAHLTSPEARSHRLISALLWAAQILMGALFILLGLVKLNGGECRSSA